MPFVTNIKKIVIIFLSLIVIFSLYTTITQRRADKHAEVIIQPHYFDKIDKGPGPFGSDSNKKRK